MTCSEKVKSLFRRAELFFDFSEAADAACERNRPLLGRVDSDTEGEIFTVFPSRQFKTEFRWTK